MSAAAPPEPGLVSRRSRVLGMTVAKAGVIVISPNCHGKLIAGFSFGADPDRAERIAKLEVLERYYALFDVVQPTLLDGRFVRAMAWPSLSPIAPLPVEQCVLGAHPFGQNDFLDASGLACHRDIGASAEHAVHELLERHFLASIWYLGEPLISHAAPSAVGQDYRTQLYTLEQHPLLPFVLAVISHCDGRFAAFGSSFALDLASARKHAINEAAMLLDGYLEGDSGLCASSKDRVLSLRDQALTKRRLDHVASICASTSSWPLLNRTDVHRAYEQLLEEIGPVSVAVLHEDDELTVCRAIIPTLRRLVVFRKTHEAHEPSDPFC